MKVGDSVVLFRVGKVVAVHDGEPYPIEVLFEGGCGIPAFDVNGFTADGKTFEGDTKPALFTEQELELQFIAKFALRLMPSGKYIAQSNDGWFLVYEQKPNLPDDAGYWQSDFPSVYVCRTEPAANPTNQIFKISDILNHE